MKDERKVSLNLKIDDHKWEGFADQLQRLIDQIPDHKLPKIAIHLNENKVASHLQNQLNSITSRLYIDLPPAAMNSATNANTDSHPLKLWAEQRMRQLADQRHLQRKEIEAQIKSAQAAANEMAANAAASLSMPMTEPSKFDQFLTEEFYKLLGKSKDTVLEALKSAPESSGSSGSSGSDSAAGLRGKLSSSLKAAAPLMAAEVAFDGIDALLDELIVTQEEAQQTALKTREEYQQLHTQIRPLREAISATDDSITQLKNKGPLSLVEQKQLDSLQNTRKELELQLRLTEQLSQSKRAEASDAAIIYLNKMATQKEQRKDTESNIPSQKRVLLLSQSSLDLFDRTREQMKQVDDFEQKKAAALFQLQSLEENSGAYRRTNQEIERYNTLIEKSMELIRGNVVNMQANKDQLNPFDKKGAEYIKNIEDVMTEYSQWREAKFTDLYSQENFASARKNLNELAQSGRLDENALQNYPALVEALKDIDITAEEACDRINELNFASQQIALTPIDQMAASMAEARDAFDTLAAVLSDVSGGGIAPETILSLQEQFGNPGSLYSDSLSVIADSSSSYQEVEQAVNDLATAYLLNDEALQAVDNDTQAALASMLESLGVINATEVAEKAVAAAKMEKAIATEIENSDTYELTESSKNLVYELYHVAAGTAEADRMLKIWEMQKAIAMNNGLAGFIANDAARFYDLAQAIGVAQTQLLQYAAVLASLGVTAAAKAVANATGNKSAGLQADLTSIALHSQKQGLITNIEKDINQKTNAFQVNYHAPGGSYTPRGSVPHSSYAAPSSPAQGIDKDENLEKYNEELATLKHLRAMDEIDAKNYYQKLTELRDQYLAQDDGTAKDEYLSQFRQASEEIYRGHQELFDERMQLSVNYINERKFYDDWGADNEIAALQRVQQWVKGYYEQGIIDYETYVDTKREYDHQLYEAQKKEFTDHLKTEKEALETKKRNLQTIVDLTVKLIKQEKQEEIDRLENQIDRYDNLIDAKKESLRLSEKELSYEKKLNNHLKDISKLQTQADLLANDDSREAQAKRAELLDQIAEKQEDLNQFQHDDAIEKTEEALDRQKKLFDEEKQAEIKTIKDYLNQSGQLVQDAMNRIDSQGDILYQDLVRWNLEYGDGITGTVESAWHSATEALKEYQTTLNAMQKLDDRLSTVDKMQSGNLSQAEIIAEMRANAAKWHTVATKKEKDDLSKRNSNLGKMLKKYAPEVNREDSTGIWYWDKERTNPIFHDGLGEGFVGNTADLKQHEMYALLTKDELVLNKADQLQIGSRLKMLDLMSQFFSSANSQASGISHLQNGAGFNQGITIQVDAPVQISGHADQDTLAKLNRFGVDLARTIGQEFTKKGFHSDITLNTIKP